MLHTQVCKEKAYKAHNKLFRFLFPISVYTLLANGMHINSQKVHKYKRRYLYIYCDVIILHKYGKCTRGVQRENVIQEHL